MNDRLRVEVCLSLPTGTLRRMLDCTPGTSIAAAAEMSGLMDAARERGIDVVGYGVYGKRKEPSTPVRDRDRIELYRALIADPKIARQRRVAHQRALHPDRWVRR